MEPAALAGNATLEPKFRFSSGDASMDDPDVVEIPEIGFASSNSNKRKRAKVVPVDIIDVDEDEQPHGVFLFGKKINIYNEEKATSGGYEKNRGSKRAESSKATASTSSSANFGKSSSKREIAIENDEVMKNYRLFKQFDFIQDYSDHHYIHEKSKTMQPSQNWIKKIQHEWKILEKDLPDSIFVRVYEERMDLLRAVIIGAAGTPYHDGLFFFDFHFRPTYPNVPPQVHYHSGGLRLNPNLYNCGKVCLSLLNTWTGKKEERWTPGKSTVLQVLLSIQALVLNAKPFFNEPGFIGLAGKEDGEKRSHDYNENTYILSCKTMLYTLKTPPKGFKDLVAGHFRERAHSILLSCKAYKEGAQVGCLVGGGVQDLDEGDKSGSENFKTQVGMMVEILVKAFAQNGAKDCKQFLPQTGNRNVTDNTI